jgi:hypothetical protein
MIRIERVAALIESIYYNGRVKSEKKLDFKDFLEHARYAHGAIMRKLYYEMKNAGEKPVTYFSQVAELRTYDVSEADARGRRRVEIENALVLPRGLGIISVDSAADEKCDVHFHQTKAGSDWLYQGAEYEDTPMYSLRSGGVVLRGAPDGLKQVEVLAVLNDTEIDIPLDVAFDIVNSVLGVDLKVAGFPVDKTTDQNPNVVTVKQRLAQPESI